MRRLFLFLLTVGMSAAAFAQTPSDTRAMDWANGDFEILKNEASSDSVTPTGCASDMRYRYVADPKTLRFAYVYNDDREPYGADIINFGPKYFMIEYDDPEKVLEDGTPEIWIMFFETPDEFYWIRKDWLNDGKFGRTDKRRRCINVS